MNAVDIHLFSRSLNKEVSEISDYHKAFEGRKMINLEKGEKPLFRGGYEWFGIWMPAFLGSALAIPIFWGTGQFNATILGFLLYIFIVIGVQGWLLSFFYVYKIYQDRIYIRFPFRIGREKQIKILIKDINCIVHDSSKHQSGLYATKHIIEIHYGTDHTFNLTVSKYGTTLDQTLAFFKNQVQNTVIK